MFWNVIWHSLKRPNFARIQGGSVFAWRRTDGQRKKQTEILVSYFGYFACFTFSLQQELENIAIDVDIESSSSFLEISSKHMQSQTISARELNCLQNFLLLLSCHVPYVICHVSHITCPFLFFLFGQGGWASYWRVCYQWSLPCLVIKRPGVAGAVPQTPCYCWIHTFHLHFLPIRMSQGAYILRECSTPTTCHVSHFMCYVLF